MGNPKWQASYSKECKRFDSEVVKFPHRSSARMGNFEAAAICPAETPWQPPTLMAPHGGEWKTNTEALLEPCLAFNHA